VHNVNKLRDAIYSGGFNVPKQVQLLRAEVACLMHHF